MKSLLLSLLTQVNKAFWLLVCALLFLSVAQAAEPKNKELQQVQQRIEAQQAFISKRQKSVSRQQKKLKNSDVKIGLLSQQIRKNRSELSIIKQEVVKLKNQQAVLNKEKKQQQSILAQQLESAYRTGNYDYLKVILNQQDPERIERTLTYYKYLNNARLKSLDQLKVTYEQIDKNTKQLQDNRQVLEALSLDLKQQKRVLLQSKKEREKTLLKLKTLLGSDKLKLTQLQESELELQTKIKRAMQTFSKATHAGLKQMKGRLAWPTKGKLIHKYGSRHTGVLKRKGLVIAAPEGRIVSSVESGQVIFANWLKGYGLIVVIDHGKGYMSLYAYNQSLLIQVGERVSAGEAIATVGDSGGQSRSSLYFELRYQGKAINPIKWLKKR